MLGFKLQDEDQRCKAAKLVDLTSTKLIWQSCLHESSGAKTLSSCVLLSYIPFSPISFLSPPS